ncbi:hypothetical protein [Desulforhabdus sp. TSK]|uniref:hypothetical protein n=1 Tax=Desulforhabdus sp. TSK TaxID=2925014 RepID=UPI001FC845DF|nr:hypothetical protein [Desulforhabdus sp. TSK]GKT08899.1 hypothetical protein DSTSK_22040 [Desulforhabdus sp. TSK]
MQQAYRTEAEVAKDGTLTVKGLPFQAGDKVEVIVRRHKHREPRNMGRPLLGKPIQYIDPFGSVAEEDWEVLK